MFENLRWLVAAALVCHSTAFAQTITAAKPTPSISASTATTATSKPSNTGEIYRWVDSKGKVQYSADVPEERRSTARKVDTRSNIVSSQVPASIGVIAPQSSPSAQQPLATRQPSTSQEKCEAAWQRYNESVACFAQYRQGINAGKTGSAISAEGQAKCQNLAEPAPCR